MDWIKFDPARWLEGTLNLTPEEKGIYIDLCMLYYARDGDLPDDAALICRASGIRPQFWQRIRSSLIEKKKMRVDTSQTPAKLLPNSCETRLKEAQNFSQTQSKRAEKGWVSRKNVHEISAVQMPLPAMPPGNANTSTTTYKSSFGKNSEQKIPLPNNGGESIPVSRELAAIVRDQMTEPQRTYDGTRPVDPRYVSDKPFSREESGKKPIEPLEQETGSLATAPLGGALRSPVSSETPKEATEKASKTPAQLTRAEYDAMLLRRGWQ